MEFAGGPQAKRGRSKRPAPGPDDEEKDTSGGHQAKRGQTERPLPGSDVEEKHEKHEKLGKHEKHRSSPITRLTRAVSNKNEGHQAINGSPLPRCTRSNISTAQSPDANCTDRKVGRGSPHEVTEKLRRILSQFLDGQKKVHEIHNLEITNLRHECRSLLEERSSALQKSNEVFSLRLHSGCQNLIEQLEAALENSVREVDLGFNNCCKELKADKSSVHRLKRGFSNCLQEIRQINTHTPLLIVDLQRNSGEHDSSEKNFDNGGHESQACQSKEANGLVCGIERSTSGQLAEAEKTFPDYANYRGSCILTAREKLFEQVAAIIRDRQIWCPDKIPVIYTALSKFLECKEIAHDIEIADIRAKCLSLHEDRSFLKQTNEVLQNSNEQLSLRSKVVCQNVISQLEAVQKSVDEVEHVFNNRRKELKAARNSVCGLVKHGFNRCLQQTRQIKSDTPVLTSLHNFSGKSKPEHANGEMSGICGSYADDAATPSLLQAALSIARVAVNRLEKVVSKVKKAREDKTVRLQTPAAGPDVFFARPHHSCYYVKSIVNRLFFEGFENESFNTLLGISRFPNPNLRQRNFYEYYLRERDLPYAGDSEDPQFKEFCQLKSSSLLAIILRQCTGTKMEISRLEELGDPQLTLSFRGAARSVWLLHKLAFSLEPPVAIFRVEAGVDVDPDYMDTIVDLDDNENFVSKVGFMIAPGLRIRKTIMRCEVYLAAATKTPN